MQILSQTAEERCHLPFSAGLRQLLLIKTHYMKLQPAEGKYIAYTYKRGNHTVSESPASTITSKRLVRVATSQVIPVLLFVRSPGESHCYEGQYKNQSEETGASLFRFMQLEHCNLGICCV